MKGNIFIGMTSPEINMIQKYLSDDMIVLEWGSGGSTLYFPRYVKRYFSIEHNKHWYEKGTNAKPDNCTIYWVKENAPRTRPTKRKEFKDYVEYIHCLGIEKFDAVLIDGRARIYCAFEVKPYLKEDSIIFLHDCHRKEYKEIYEHYDEIDKVGNLLVLKIKNGKK